MNRRSAIRSVIVISAGAALLPACAADENKAIVLRNLSLTGSQEKVLSALAESILPKTRSFIGAADLRSHEFMLTMIDDCSSPEEQKKFTGGQKAFEDFTRKKFGKSFTDLSATQKKDLLNAIERKTQIPNEVAEFYKTVKDYTIQSFTSSKEYLTDIKKYKMVPGPDFKGSVPLTNP